MEQWRSHAFLPIASLFRRRACSRLIVCGCTLGTTCSEALLVLHRPGSSLPLGETSLATDGGVRQAVESDVVYVLAASPLMA